MKPHASKLLSEGRFWEVIEVSLDGTNSVGLETSKQLDSLTKALDSLTDTELIGFEYHFERCFRNAYRQDLWAVSYVVMCGCSDDCFMDFRVWLITRGREVYEAALREPVSLADEFDKIPEGDIPLWDAGPFVKRVFDARHGEGSYRKEEERYDFDRPDKLVKLDFQWDGDDEESIKKICPKTFDKWWENMRF